MPEDSILDKTVQLCVAYLGNNTLPADQVGSLIMQVHTTLLNLGAPTVGGQPIPAVPIDESVTDEYLVCLEDGEKVKLLKRYLKDHHGMTPEEYLAKWKLPEDYPLVAPSYSQQRSKIAKEAGLGKS